MKECGFSILELLVVMSISTILMGIGANRFLEMKTNIGYSANLLEAKIKTVRSKALSHTTAYTILPSSATTMVVKSSSSCDTPDEDKALENSLDYTLNEGAYFSSTTWSLCYSPRGIGDNSIEIEIRDEDSDIRTLKIYIGGAIKIDAGGASE